MRESHMLSRVRNSGNLDHIHRVILILCTMQSLEHPGLPGALRSLRVPALHDHGEGNLDGEGQLHRLRNRSVKPTNLVNLNFPEYSTGRLTTNWLGIACKAIHFPGISNTVGRVVLGWLVDFPWVSSLLVTNVSLVSSGICVLAFTACEDFAGFISVALMLGECTSR